MFTGIIRKTISVKAVKNSPVGLLLTLENPKLRPKMGDSISVNGVCSTVVQTGKVLGFEYMPETLERSTTGSLRAGETVNLEESLRASDRLDGHIVLGHVDTVGKISAVAEEGNSKVFTVEPREPKRFMKFIAEKGSVAVDGVSLTVVSVRPKSFTFKLIPHTLKHTAFQEREAGSFVNIEFDILAKYLERFKAKP